MCTQIVEQENRLRASGRRTQPDKPSLPDVKPAIAQFDQLKPGRRCVVSLPQPDARVSGTDMSSDGKDKGNHSARFTAAVLDVDVAAAQRAVRDCAVFIVPQVNLTCSVVSHWHRAVPISVSSASCMQEATLACHLYQGCSRICSRSVSAKTRSQATQTLISYTQCSLKSTQIHQP